MDKRRELNLALFMNRAQSLMMDFQFIEQLMKIYLGRSFELIRKRVKGTMPFNRYRSNIENFPYGKLLKEFKIYNDNTELYKKLYSLNKERNHLAHVGFILAFHEDMKAEYLEKERQRIEVLQKLTMWCLETLREETKRF